MTTATEPLVPQPAAQFIASQSMNATSPGTTATVPYAATVLGQLELLFICTAVAGQGGGTPTTPTGWTQFAASPQSTGSAGAIMYGYYHSADHTSGSLTVTFNQAGGDLVMATLAYGFIAAGTGLLGQAGTAADGLTSQQGPGYGSGTITPASLGILAMGNRSDNGGACTYTTPTGWNARITNVADAGGFPANVSIFDKINPPSTQPTVTISAAAAACALQSLWTPGPAQEHVRVMAQARNRASYY